MNVTLIDPEVNPGGVCLYRGCIPSKALLHVAKLIEESHQAKNWGIEFAAPKIDLARLRSWKEGVVKKLTGGLGVALQAAQSAIHAGTSGVREFHHAARHQVRRRAKNRSASTGSLSRQARGLRLFRALKLEIAAHDGFNRRAES